MAGAEQIGLWSAIRQLFQSLSPRRRRQFAFVLGLMLMGALAELAAIGSVLPFLSLLGGETGEARFGWLFQAMASLGATSGEQRLITAALLFMALAVVAAAIRLQLAWSSQAFVLRVGHDLGVEIQRRILLQPYSFHVGQNTSEIIASLEKVQTLTFGVLLQLMQAVAAAVIAAFIIALLIAVDAFAATIAFIVLATLYLIVSILTGRRLGRNSAVIGRAYNQRVQIVQESLGGIRDIIIDNTQSVYLDAFRAVDERFIRSQASSSFIGNAPRFIIEAAGMILIAALALVLAGKGGLAAALPVLGALALGALRLLPLLQQIYRGWTMAAANRSIIGQVSLLLKLPVSAEREIAEHPPPLPFEHEIRLDQVNCTYPGRPHPAVDNVNLTIVRGSRVAIIGKTGSGKSTLADLIMGLIEPCQGRITIDGVPLDQRTQRAWQRNIAHVPQAIFLSDASIARNIAFGVPENDIDMARVAKAARIAQLDELIELLPQGFETKVGERGVRLSGGQRQRLGIARAVYKNAPLLILDEATSALDRDTESVVLGGIEQLTDRTIIIIAHRQSTVQGCDMVVRLDKGRIVDEV